MTHQPESIVLRVGNKTLTIEQRLPSYFYYIATELKDAKLELQEGEFDISEDAFIRSIKWLHDKLPAITTNWVCEVCGEVRSSRHEKSMCEKLAELKRVLREKPCHICDYHPGSVTCSAMHEAPRCKTSSEYEPSGSDKKLKGWHVVRLRCGGVTSVYWEGPPNPIAIYGVEIMAESSGYITPGVEDPRDVMEIDGVKTEAGAASNPPDNKG
jgi:hypothetical protein